MIVPAFWCTIIISNWALKQHHVPRETLELSTHNLDLAGATDKELSHIASPRETKNGEIFYLSNGIASWLNCSIVDYEDIDLLWVEEVDMLKEHGLQFGRDMARVQWDEDGKLFACNDIQVPVKCDWIKMIWYGYSHWQNKIISDVIAGTSEDHSYALLWVDESKRFKGYNTRRINK